MKIRGTILNWCYVVQSVVSILKFGFTNTIENMLE